MTFQEEINESNQSENIEKLVFASELKEYEKKENYFTLKIVWKFHISVYKPLITLKLGLFLWYAASISVMTFYSVFFKQRGFSLEELSFMYTLSPILLFFYTASLGVLADKSGRAKPILLFNILLNAVSTVCFIFMPNVPSVHLQSSPMYCRSESDTYSWFLDIACGIRKESIFVRSCEMNCPSEHVFMCNETDYFDCVLSRNKIENGSLSEFQNNNNSDNCQYSANALMKKFEHFSLCQQVSDSSCNVTCNIESNHNRWIEDNRTMFIGFYMVIQFVFIATYANIYRFFDITTVALSKEHNSSYGRERVWSALGAIFGPVVTGCVVQLSILISGEHNYDYSLYSFVALLFLITIVVFKTDIRGTTPGKQMWMKVIMLMKNLDVSVFFLIVTVMGTVWGFQSFFKSWYLEDLGADPFLIGLLETLKNVYGLPFLFKSKWIVNKLGYPNMFLLAIVARVIYSFSYSFLKNPWFAFLIEMTAIFGYHLLWVGVTCYAAEIAPQGITSTVLAVTGGIHFTMGRVTGSLIGGTVMSNYGGRTAFQIMGAMSLSLLIIYSLYFLCKLKKSQVNETTVVK